MLKLTTVAELRDVITQWRRQGLRIALVPTMGNLHAGHLQLVEEAKSHADKLVVSIFVNPMQFADAQGGDFDRYPRTLEADAAKLQQQQADLLFVPAVEEVYPQGVEQATRVQVPGLSDILCGEYRPGHFEGVATVVAKLFNMVQPDCAVFGEKDFQQLLVIRRMVTGLCFPIEIIGSPTVREADGLAMSSRNQYLNPEQRQQAVAIHQTLQWAKTQIAEGAGDYRQLETQASRRLADKGFKVEYFAIRDADDLLPATLETAEVRILVAAWMGDTRLIDNLSL